MALRDDQSPSSWSSGESQKLWNAVDGYNGNDLAERMFLQLRSMASTDLTEFRSLIVRGANLDATDQYDRTLEAVAKEHRRTDALKILKTFRKAGWKGAHVRATASWGEVDRI